MKYLYVVLIFCFLSFRGAFAEKNHFNYKYGSGNAHQNQPMEETVKRMQMFGERCSGTCFLGKMLRRNFPTTPLKLFYGNKHFPCWFDFPFDEEFYKRPVSDYTLEGSDDTLFVVIFRNPYDWLRSFQKKAHHGVHKMLTMNFHQFIRSPWLAKRGGKHPYIYPIEQDPKTRKPFENVMKLRTARIRTMLRIKDLAKHVYFINYETLKNHPKEVLKEIHDIFGMELEKEFVPVENYKGKSDCGTYQGSHYGAISQEDVKFINQNLDKKLEKKIGYKLVNQVPST